jgi:hypothetical protein
MLLIASFAGKVDNWVKPSGRGVVHAWRFTRTSGYS